MVKLTRRNFFNYASHTIVAAALWKTFQSTRAFGAQGRRKILICTSPNGHHNFQDTANALQNGLSEKTKAQTLVLDGLNFAVTQGGVDWHFGETCLLSFSDSKQRAPSFFTALGLNNNDIKYLGVDVGDRHYAHDSGSNPINAIQDPQLAMRTFFGRSFQSVNSHDLALIQAGKKNVIDPCLDDIKRLRNLLGSDAAIFNNYLDQLQKHYNSIDEQSEGGNAGGESGENPETIEDTPFEAPTCNKSPALRGGGSVEAKHEDMLEVAYQLMACDMAQVIVLSFLNTNTDPQHNLIHSNGFSDGGASFKGFTNSVHNRMAKFANRLTEGDYNILDRSAMVYISEGGAHADSPNGSFNTGHPTHNIPCAVYGSLGGAITKNGIFKANGQTNKNLWRQLADAMTPNGEADLDSIGGGGVPPIGI